MKGLKRLILLFFFIIIALPVGLIGAAMIKDATPPDYYTDFDYETYDPQNELLNKLNSIAINNMLGKKQITIDEETVNKIMYKLADGFINTAYELDANNPEEKITVSSVWTDFGEDELTIHALIEYKKVGTTMTLKLGFETLEDSQKVEIKTFKVGKLPFPNALFTFALNTAEDYDVNVRDGYTYGDVNYDELYVTIDDSHIDEIIKDSLGTDLIVIDSIEVTEDLFLVNYAFNTANTEAVAIQNAITAINGILNDETLISDVSANLDPNNVDQMAFKEDFEDTITLLSNKVNSSTTSTEFTEEEMALLTSLAENYSKIDTTVQEQVAVSIESNIDPEVISNLNVALESLDVEGYSGISDLLIGLGS